MRGKPCRRCSGEEPHQPKQRITTTESTFLRLKPEEQATTIRLSHLCGSKRRRRDLAYLPPDLAGDPEIHPNSPASPGGVRRQAPQGVAIIASGATAEPLRGYPISYGGAPYPRPSPGVNRPHRASGAYYVAPPPAFPDKNSAGRRVSARNFAEKNIPLCPHPPTSSSPPRCARRSPPSLPPTALPSEDNFRRKGLECRKNVVNLSG